MQTENMMLSIMKLKPSAIFSIISFIQIEIGFPLILSLFPHLLDNNYLVDFMAEGESPLPCQPFPQSMVIMGERGGSHFTRLECVHAFIVHVNIYKPYHTMLKLTEENVCNLSKPLLN